jgi:hypothetical protein
VVAYHHRQAQRHQHVVQPLLPLHGHRMSTSSSASNKRRI